MTPLEERHRPLYPRLVLYAIERFPLAGNGAMTALMCAGTILPLIPVSTESFWRIAWSFFTILPLFFVMRVADEHKDYADDLAYRPERPVPRGLVTLAELRAIAFLLAFVPVTIVLFIAPKSLVPLLLAGIWIGAMSIEFGVKAWLRDHPVIYLLSHMLAMPFLALVIASFTFTDGSGHLSLTVVGVLALAFAAGLVLEIGRKLWAVSEEREGVETYSGLWGPRRAATVWTVAATTALALGVLVPGLHPGTTTLAAAVLAIALFAAVRYAQKPDEERARLLRKIVVVVVMAAYALAIAGALIK